MMSISGGCFGTPPPVSTLVRGGKRRRLGVGRFCWQQPDRPASRYKLPIAARFSGKTYP
jgi:hypothetical protein